MKKYFVLLFIILCFVCCDEKNPVIPNEPGTQPSVPVPPTTEEMPVVLRSRAADGDFAKGDCVGVYMVNYLDGRHVSLKSSGNYIDNWKFLYDGEGSWAADQKLYYKDEETAADFYAYHPYSDIADATGHDVSVPYDQSAESDYEKADFLWGRALNCIPSTDPVDITLEHMMSKAVVVLKPGTGFTEEELIAAAPVVRFLDMKCDASFNLGTGELSVAQSVRSVTPNKSSALTYQAILVPQSVEDKDVVEVRIGESVYKLRRTVVFEKGKEYTFTVTIQRTEGGVSVGIGSWDLVGEDFGGVVS